MAYTLALAVVLALIGSIPFIVAARSRKRRADAEKIAEIVNEYYRELRAAMQSFIASGEMPSYTDQDWLGLTTRGSSESLQATNVIYYKDNKCAFDSACDFMDTSLKKLKIIPALVERTAPTSDGLQMCQLNLASVRGGTPILFCTTVNDRIPQLRVGDLVAFQVAALNPEWQRSSHLGRIGFIVAKLEPAISTNQGWKVSK